MRILIATGIYPPDIGGPAKYGKGLEEALEKAGHQVKVLPYRFEKKLPFGIRQLFYLVRIFTATFKTDAIIALDTVSVGFPAAISSFLLGKKIAIRTGGDFLWETYIERTGIKIPLPDFYEAMPSLVFKEKLIAKIHQFIIDYSDFIVFSTDWQRDIWTGYYTMNPEKIRIVENCYYEKHLEEKPKGKVFLAAGRQIVVKNFDNLEEGFKKAKEKFPDIVLDRGSYNPEEYEKLLRECYAVVAVSLSEISPNSIIEAISYNKPFILTKYHGISKRLGKAGVIVDPNNIEDIEKGFSSLTDDKIYKKETEKIKKLVFTHSFDEIAKEFLEIINHKS